MTPSEIPLDIYRGASFDHEFITQRKVFVYDPDVHTDPDDLQRTHAENLEFHGYTWEYVDFLADYTAAEMVFKKPWLQTGENAGAPLKTLTLANNDIELTAKSVKVGMTPAVTKALSWNEATYELKLTTAAGKVDILAFGAVMVAGEKA